HDKTDPTSILLEEGIVQSLGTRLESHGLSPLSPLGGAGGAVAAALALSLEGRGQGEGARRMDAFGTAVFAAPGDFAVAEQFEKALSRRRELVPAAVNDAQRPRQP